MLPVVYTVKPGESLYSIAKKFGTTPNKIKEYNDLQSYAINVGQKIYITAIIYTVQPGDSLFNIARTLNTTTESIVTLNNLTSNALYIGQPLTIPFYTEALIKVNNANIRSAPSENATILYKMAAGSKLSITGVSGDWYKVKLFNDTFAWVSKSVATFKTYNARKPISRILGYYTIEEGPGLPSSYESFVTNKNNISELGLFLFRINPNNALKIEKFGQFTDEYVKNIVYIAHKSNVKILATIHNLLYKEGGTKLAKDLVKQMVATPESRKMFIDNIMEIVKKYGFDGVNMDIEDVYIEDTANLSAFYIELSARLKKEGYYVSAALPARIRDTPFNLFSDPFDYGAIGKVLDEAVIMLYNEHGWPGSGPGPVVSIGWMEKVIGYTITKMPREKIVAAVSVFGFDFNLKTGGVSYASYPIAIELAKKYNKEIRFDEKTQTPTFAYVDEKGENHEVWFEDSRSIKAKIDKAYEMGIKGVALWRLGMEDKAVWDMIQKDVVVSYY